MEIHEKQCRTCHKPKPATKDFFNAVPAYISPDCLNPQCKECRKATRKDNQKQVKPQKEYTYTPMGVEVPLTQGKFTLVDECDLDIFDGCKWSYGSRTTPNAKKKRHNEESGYVKRGILVDDKPKTIRLHWLVMERVLGHTIPEGYLVDHHNGNPLDNRRENLRLATDTQNARNSSKQGDGNNPYKGISFRKDRNNWRAQICVDGKRIRLGAFKTAEEAAIAYNKAAIEHFGEYAKLNDIAS